MTNTHLLEKRLVALFGEKILGVELKGNEDTGDIIIYTNGRIPDPPKKVLDHRVFVIDRGERSPLGGISQLPSLPPEAPQVKRKGRRARMARRRHPTRPEGLEQSRNRARWLLNNNRSRRGPRMSVGQLPGREKARYMVNNYVRDSRYKRPRRKVNLYRERQPADRARILSANQFRESKTGVGEGDFRRNRRALDREDYMTTEPWQVWSRPFVTEIEPEFGRQDPRKGRRFK